MDWIALLKSKTVWTGVAALTAAAGSYFTGQMTGAQAAQLAVTGLLGLFLRMGVQKTIPAQAVLYSAGVTAGTLLPGAQATPAPLSPVLGAASGPVAAPLGDVMALFQDTVAQTLELAQKQALQELSAALQGLAPVVSTMEAPAPAAPAVQP